MIRPFTLVVVACLAGAGAALFAAGRTWADVVRFRPAPLPPVHEVSSGTVLLPWLPALALVALAGAGALLATRGPARTAVGVLLVGCGGGLVAGAGAHLAAGWPLVAAVGGLLVAGAGVATLVRGGRWPAMGSRYERPVRRGVPADTAAQMWDALDRGDDPTGR